MSITRKPGTRNAPDLHRPYEVAKALNCSEWWVKEQARRRRIPFTWIGGSYRFTDDHLAEIIRIFEVRPNATGPAETTQAGTPRRRPVASSPTAPRLTARPPRRGQRADSESPAA